MAVVIGGAIIGAGASLYSGYKQGQKQDAAMQAGAEITQEQLARSREMLNYFNSTFKPAEMALMAEAFGFDPSNMPVIEQTPDQIAANKARIAELQAVINEKTGNIASHTSRDNEGLRVGWRAEIAAAQKEIDQINAPKYDTSKIGPSAKQQATTAQLESIKQLAAQDPDIKAALDNLSGLTTSLSSEAQAGLSKLDKLSIANPQIAAGLQGLAQRVTGPASAQSFIDESRAPINYYESNPLQYETEAGRASAEVQQSADRERQAASRRMLSRGINPNSGAALEFDRLAGLQTSANKVFASNAARDVARTGDYGRKLTDYQRRIQGMGLANDANQSEFGRAGMMIDANRANDLDQFNKGLTTYNARQTAGQQDFARQGMALDAMRGVGTDNFNKATAAFSLERGNALQDYNMKLGALGLGRGLQTAGIQGLGNAAAFQGSLANQYGASAGNWGAAAGNFANLGFNAADKAGWFDKPKPIV